MLTTILSLAIVLGVLIFVHEAGHFIAAKWAGIYVHRFSLGLGAPVKALTFRRGETEYSISWLPLGGYVKMASREEDAASAMLEGGAAAPVPPDRVFEAKPVWKRMIVILAGVTMNVLFAWLVYAGLLWVRGESVLPITRVGEVATDLPPGAEELRRLSPGDRITAVAGTPVETWDDIQTQFVATSGDSFQVQVEGKSPITIRIHRDAIEARIRAIQSLSQYLPPVIGVVQAGGPGEKAGVRVGDTLIAVGGASVGQWSEAVTAIESRPDQDVSLLIGRAGGRTELIAHSTSDTVADSVGVHRRTGKLRLGVDVPERHIPVSFPRALQRGAAQTLAVSTQIVRVIRGMFSGRVSTREVGGPIAIGVMAGQSAQQGLAPFLAFMAMISVNLAVLNLLPIPVMDGGQFLFLLGEAILRRPLSLKLRERLTYVGLVLVVLLMVFAFSNDIRRLVGM